MTSTPAIRAALRGYEPSKEQWDAISQPLEPAHLVAGAGSGKTAVMAARIVWVIENQGYRPDQVLGLTFTNKAAAELASRVTTALAELDPDHADDVTVKTYNAFADAIVREHGLLVGVEPEAGLLSDAQRWQLVLGSLDDLPPFDHIEVRSSYVVRDALTLAEAMSNHDVSVDDVVAACDALLAARGVTEDIAATARKRKELCTLVGAYVKAKVARRKIDFGDQIIKAVEVLRRFDDVRTAYQEQFPVVLLDEYQDTNVAQRHLIEALVKPTGMVTAVGDTRQAIYAWRGATMYNLIGFPANFPRGEDDAYAETSLSENFRSGSRILAAANHIIERIDPARRPGAPLRAHEANGEGRVRLGLFTDDRAEAQWIADEIKTLHATATAVGRALVDWRDIAILVRRRRSMDPIIEALDAADIPVEVVGLGGLLKTPEVTEVVAWLRCLETKPGANRWLARVLLGPRWRIDFRDLALCARWAAQQNWGYKVRLAGGDEERARDMEPGDVGFALAEALSHLDDIDGLGAEAKRRLEAFAGKLAALRERSGAPLLEVVQEVLGSSGITDALRASSAERAPAARQNIANFLDQVAAFAPIEGQASLRTFIEYLDAAEDAEETLEAAQPADQDSVKLMTVHQAKGLEFECVFVPSVAARKNAKGEHVWSVFPNTMSPNPLRTHKELPYEVREDRRHLPLWEPGAKVADFVEAVKERVLEDERRLFYVAMTRAKQHLGVTASWWVGRDAIEKGPSKFWEELDELAEGGVVEAESRADFPSENPAYQALEAERVWPRPARAGADDPLWPEGFGAVADRLLAGDTDVAALAASLSQADRVELDAQVAAHTEELDVIAAARRVGPEAEPRLPDIVSATAALRHAAGKLDAWDIVRPLPDQPTSERRIGTEVHRLIEQRLRGVASWPEETELDDPLQAADGPALQARIAEAIDHWDTGGWEARTVAELRSGEPMVELPFALRWSTGIVRGRIDAVFTTDDGGLEIVDFKTGARFEPDDHDQLALYAESLFANGLVPEGTPVTLTYAFLDGGPPVTRPWSPGATGASP